MDIGDAFRTRITDRIGEAIEKYFDRGFSGQVTVIKAGSRYSADCMIRLDSGASLQAAGEGQEPTQAFDAAAERLEKRLRRYKRRLRDHHNGDGQPSLAAQAYILEAESEEIHEGDEPTQPIVIADVSTTIESLTVLQAVMRLDLGDLPALMFRNQALGRLNMVFRRPDGNIGWVDPKGNEDAAA